ncbi:uncharacterized protein A4U43_C08F30180 [Asparagus officinalis]|nr:uncharacterized protein A4U43_C08F30180 [Asparagus officinalis]
MQTLNLYLSFNLPNLALSLYNSLSKPTLSLQNLILRSLSDHGYYSHLLHFYHNLQYSGSHCSDNFTFPFVIKACAALLALRTGKEVHCSVLRTGYVHNLVMQTTLVDMYAKMGLMVCARTVFDEILERDLISWNALIAGYSLNGMGLEAINALRSMQVEGNLRPNSSTFVSVLGLGGERFGKQIHGFCLKLGFVKDCTVVSALITMYADVDLGASRVLFDEVDSKDLVSWNTMISAYSHNGEANEAFDIFSLMHSEGWRPNLVTMISVIQSCGDLSSIHHGEIIHALTVKLGLADLISVATSLVSMYAKLGELGAAQILYHETPQKSLLLCNSMISAYILNGLPDNSLATFRDLQVNNLIPDSISIISAISGCSMSKDLKLGKSVHAYSLRRGFDLNINVMNALLALYSDCNQFSDICKLFHRLRARNVVSWNTLISVWARIGDAKASVASFCQMQEEETNFDLITIINILPSFYQHQDLYTGILFHSLAIKTGFESDVSLKNALISMYTNFGFIEDAHLLFESLCFRRTVVSWNALMTGYRNFSLFDEVMSLFNQMKREAQKPNSITLLNLLPSCETKLQGKSTHAFAIKNFLELDNSLCTSTMCMYARFEDLNSCCSVFKTMDKGNIVSWNTMMSVYVQSMNVGRAITAFKEMLEMRIEPDSVTMLTLASACSNLSSLALSHSLTGFAIRKGFNKSTAVVNVLIDMNARSGSSSFAREIFDQLELKDSISWSVMINAYGINGDGGGALRLFYTMQETGIKPDDITFVSILSACGHSGLVDEGRNIFESMAKVYGIQPKMKHVACIVDLLGRSGHLEEAYETVKKLANYDAKSCEEMLESLLGACRSYGDVRIGEEIGKLLSEMNHSTARSQVMLSNIYSTVKRWRKSGRLRREMGAKRLKKDPGFSLVEVS